MTSGVHGIVKKGNFHEELVTKNQYKKYKLPKLLIFFGYIMEWVFN